ncbi:MAG: DUF2887 domain-containing protein [Desulfococcaceae bacterium]
MKTDALFYELFKFDPQSLFDLISLDAEGEYVFESITAKTTEKRMDGLFRRTDRPGPNLFAEVQGYPDKKIYWRFFREISTWYEQNDDDQPFVAVVLFTDKTFDPGKPRLSCVPPCRLIRCYLPNLLKKIGKKASALTVLKPLVLEDRKKLPESVRQWDAEIRDMGLPQAKTKILSELLEYAVLQRFSDLTLEEVKKMIQLTPLEKTVAGQELIQIGLLQGKLEGKKEGKKEGKLEGKKEGKLEGRTETALNLLKMGLLTDEQIAKATKLRSAEVKKLRQKLRLKE